VNEEVDSEYRAKQAVLAARPTVLHRHGASGKRAFGRDLPGSASSNAITTSATPGTMRSTIMGRPHYN
jgi:hypothetical protein